MTLVLDAGAFLAIERGDREVAALIAYERRGGDVPVTHDGVIGQVWRGGPRQALVALLLAAVEVAPLDDALGRRSGALLGRAGTDDVIDAALVLIAADGDHILTSDATDLAALAAAAGSDVELIAV